jgi:hypothetical protein
MGECYDWVIRDWYGDGMCDIDRPCGSYEFTLNGNDIVSEDGDFEVRRKEKICIKALSCNDTDFGF